MCHFLLTKFHMEALKSNVISFHLRRLTSVEGQSAGFSRHKELPSLTRLQQRRRGQSAGHQRHRCNWQMGVWCGSGLGENIEFFLLLMSVQQSRPRLPLYSKRSFRKMLYVTNSPCPLLALKHNCFFMYKMLKIPSTHVLRHT